MPRLDECHDQVVHALEKAGWNVSPYPYIVPVPGRRPLQIDLYARRDRNGASETIIIVEVKCFPDEKSELSDLYTSIGQYLVYRSLLRRNNITDNLYLAVPLMAYLNVFRWLAMPVLSEIQLKLIVVDLEKEEIEQWLE